MQCGPCSMTLALPLQSKNEASAKYDKINNVLQDKASNGGTGKQKRRSIESADMEKIEDDGLEQAYGGIMPKIGRQV